MITEPVTRIRRVQVGVDRYQNPIFDDVAEAIEPAMFAPRSVIPSAEVGRSPVVVEPTLYWLRGWPDLVASDRVQVRGVTYDVHGVPADWRGSTVGGVTATLRETVEGAE